MNKNLNLIIASGALITITVIVNYAYKWYSKRYLPPKKWKKVATLIEIYFYPVKSMGAISFEKLFCDRRGLKISKNSRIGDRSFMVVEKRHGKFVSARQCNRLILIKQKVINNHVILYASDMEPLHINVDEISPDLRICRLWGKVVFGRDCGIQACNWISRYISNQDDGYSIVFYEENYADKNTSIRLNHFNSLYPFMEFFQGAFHDKTSFKLVSTESVDDLNNLMEKVKVSPLNFRPNFVVSGSKKPFAEDDWDWIRIGDNAIFRFFKPCPRCQVTTLNPETAVKNDNNEPIRTLVMYRQAKDLKIREDYCNNPVFGINMGNYKTGEIQVGDAVYIGINSN